jgi:hypothetical protein
MLYSVARGYALRVAAITTGKPDQTLSTAERESRGRYTEEAIETLRRALAAGYRDHVALERDSDLTAVRSDPWFGALRSGPKGKNG